MPTCPTCKGKRTNIAHINTGIDSQRHRWSEIPCFTCNGAGNISDEHATRITKGAEMRQARVARKESLYEAAARMGMTAARLSAIEHGRVGSNKDEKPE
jgi:DnaJ-class molecular chaperone